jgi:hypothetical protein
LRRKTSLGSQPPCVCERLGHIHAGERLKRLVEVATCYLEPPCSQDAGAVIADGGNASNGGAFTGGRSVRTRRIESQGLTKDDGSGSVVANGHPQQLGVASTSYIGRSILAEVPNHPHVSRGSTSLSTLSTGPTHRGGVTVWRCRCEPRRDEVINRAISGSHA